MRIRLVNHERRERNHGLQLHRALDSSNVCVIDHSSLQTFHLFYCSSIGGSANAIQRSIM